MKLSGAWKSWRWGVKLRHKEVKIRQSISRQLKYCTALCCKKPNTKSVLKAMLYD